MKNLNNILNNQPSYNNNYRNILPLGNICLGDLIVV